MTVDIRPSFSGFRDGDSSGRRRSLAWGWDADMARWKIYGMFEDGRLDGPSSPLLLHLCTILKLTGTSVGIEYIVSDPRTCPPTVYHWMDHKYPQTNHRPSKLAYYVAVTMQAIPHPPQEWLSDISPSTNLHKSIEHVELQLLQSNLGDSAAPGSGTTRAGPAGQGSTETRSGTTPSKQMTGPAPLIEIRSITDKHNLPSRDAITTATSDNRSRNPRDVLVFELSNGCTTFSDIESRSLAKLELDIMSLGYKFTRKLSDTIELPPPLRVQKTRRCTLDAITEDRDGYRRHEIALEMNIVIEMWN
ncbi:hypothetical protein BDN67DRAFT_985270 [Paxillus ammoniavirescens]|nr:hypothetical protein BDN67DRAFT_985270 [Paxillus ammoniavirescens]